MPSVAVIGAGVVGLSAACIIQEQQPGAQVTIIADKFTNDTTSHGAAGLFRPSRELIGGDPELITSMSKDSWEHYKSILQSPDAAEAGVLLTSGFLFSKTEMQESIMKDYIYRTQDTTENEKNYFPFGKEYKYQQSFTSMTVECRKYLPWLMRKFRQNGGKVIVGRIRSFQELVGKYDVVVNCAALGSQQLLSDRDVHPIRGQLIRVKAPWVKHFYFTMDNSAYIIPCADTVVLGGCRQKDNYNLNVDEDMRKEIWEKCMRIVPSLKDAKVDHEWVGLRPNRDPLRIEPEIMTFGNKKLKVVHNYGHGANGVSMSWGTSMHAAKMVNKLLTPQAKL